MKNSIMLFIVLLLTSIVDVKAADYDGATKYPVTTLVSGQFSLVVAGVQQKGGYSQLHTAMSAAVITSQKCSCEVLIKSPEIRVNTKWKVVVVGEIPLTFNWARPTERENSQVLTASEIGGYEIVRRPASGISSTPIMVKNTGSDVVQYTTTIAYMPTDKFVIAAYDTNGLYSNFIEIQPIVSSM